MSPHVNNFVTDLVLMAKAMEELPQVRHELELANGRIFTLEESLQSRELSIINLKAEVETHLASIRSLEVARDDAELRFLELEENANMAASFVRTAETNLAAVTSLLSPPKPEPVSTIQPAEEGSSAERPTDTVSTNMTSPSETVSSAETSEGHVDTSSSWADPSPGQNEADPTGAPDHADHSSKTASSEAASDNTQTEVRGKYSSLLYADWSYYVPLDKWIEGGGTEYSYNYRHPVDNRNNTSF